MIDIIAIMIWDVFSACSSWFTAVISSSQIDSIYLVVIFTILVINIILGPIFGHRGSDPAGPKKKKVDED